MKTRRPRMISIIFLSLVILTSCKKQETIPLASKTPAPTFILECTKSIGYATIFPAGSSSTTPSPQPSPTDNLQNCQRSASETISPQGNYTAKTIIALPDEETKLRPGSHYHIRFELLDSRTGDSWTLIDEWRSFDTAILRPVVLRWTEDERYLFFTEKPLTPFCAQFPTAATKRIDIIEHGIELVPGNPNTVSPDGNLLVEYTPRALAIYNLAGETSARLPISFSKPAKYGTDFTWSPDGTLLLFASFSDCQADVPKTELVLVNLTKGTIKAIASTASHNFRILSFPERNLAQLRDDRGKTWWLHPGDADLSVSPPEAVAAAQNALLAFFDALANKHYQEAVQRFGGSYETLQDMNPDIASENKAGLWQRACEQNGMECLPVESTVLQKRLSKEEFLFQVTFRSHGETFVRGPCCGADITEMPPQSVFLYHIKIHNGVATVLDLPVYVP